SLPRGRHRVSGLRRPPHAPDELRHPADPPRSAVRHGPASAADQRRPRSVSLPVCLRRGAGPTASVARRPGGSVGGTARSALPHGGQVVDLQRLEPAGRPRERIQPAVPNHLLASVLRSRLSSAPALVVGPSPFLYLHSHAPCAPGASRVVTLSGGSCKAPEY